MTSFLKVQSPRLGKSAEVVEMISVFNVRCNLFRAAVSHISCPFLPALSADSPVSAVVDMDIGQLNIAIDF